MLMSNGRLDPSAVPKLSDRDLVLVIIVADVLGLKKEDIDLLHAERRYRLHEEARMEDDGNPIAAVR